jgi:TRAP-type transport system periplasmic protein
MPLSSLFLAGYQGSKSILTRGLMQLYEELKRSGEFPHVECEVDVTAVGETANSLFKSVENGRRQICYMASGYLSERVPELGVLDLPFSVKDRKHALSALDGRAGELLKQAVQMKTGYQVLGFWDNGFRHVSNSVRPIRQASDCQGLVIRTLDNEGYRQSLAALGFVPVTTDVKDLVRVVSTGEVQAQENPLTNLMTFSLWKHHPYVSLTGHYFGILQLLCARDWFDKLTTGQRSALQEAVTSATLLQRELAEKADSLALSELSQHGVQVLLPDDIDLASMRLATQSASAHTRSRLPQDLVDAYLPVTS